MSLLEADGMQVTNRDFKWEKATMEQHQDLMRMAVCTKLCPPGLKEIKQFELFDKWRQYVPTPFQDEMCPAIPQEMVD